jgi:predicted secreted protein with PEFG-CTERM motif
LWAELLADLSNNNVVTIKVFDKTNNLIYEADAQVDANGNYSTEFSLPKSASKGSYAVTSDINLKGDVAGLIGVQGQTSIGSNVKIAVVPPQVFKVKVENHGDFDIQVATNSTVQNVDFNVEQKKVSVTVEGESGTKGVSHISIPKAMVSGDMTVMIDGKVIPSDKVVVTSNTELETEVEVNYNHSVHTIDIVGTQAVPEFGAITMMILVVAIISIVAITAKTRIIPRF